MSPGTYLVPSTISINKALTIKGVSSGFADAAASRVRAGPGCGKFMLDIAQTVTITNLTMQGTAECAVLLHEADVSLQNCKICINTDSNRDAVPGILHRMIGNVHNNFGGVGVVSISGNLKISGCEIGPCTNTGLLSLNNAPTRTVCTKGHPMQESSGRGYICDECGSRNPSSNKWACRQCNYDICHICMQKRQTPIPGKKTTDCMLELSLSETKLIRCKNEGVKCTLSGARITAKNCCFDQCGLGIWCSAASRLSLRGSKIIGTKPTRDSWADTTEASSNATGLFIAEGAQADVNDCIFTEHFKGIHIEGPDSKLIGKGCSVTSCQGSAVSVKSAKASVKIDSFRIEKCGMERSSQFVCAGMTVFEGAAAHLQNCHFSECHNAALMSRDKGTLMHSDSRFDRCEKKEWEDSGGKIVAM